MGILVDGTDLETAFGFIAAPPADDQLAAAGRTYAVQEGLGRPGIFLSVDPTQPAREISVHGTLTAVDVATARTARDRLLGWIRNGVIDVVFPEAPDRFHRGVAEAITVQVIRGAPAYEVTWTLRCADAHAHALDLTALNVATDEVETPLADAPVYPDVTITGPASSPVLIYADADGVERGRMDFTGTELDAGESLVLDTLRQTLASGTGANRAAALVEPPSSWLVLDPYHAASPVGPWPTVRVTSGAAVVSYRMAYL